MNTTKLILTAIPIGLCGLFSTGCAQFMAIGQPRPFTPSSLTAGTRRTAIVAELGQPITSEVHSNQLTDAFHYIDGGQKNSAAAKTGRILVYTAGDIFTCWLDQVIWMPAEAFGFKGTTHSVMVDYTKDDDGSWHAATIEDKIVGHGDKHATQGGATSTASGASFSVYAQGPAYQPVTYSPPALHYTGSGTGAVQAGLMNNLGRH